MCDHLPPGPVDVACISEDIYLSPYINYTKHFTLLQTLTEFRDRSSSWIAS